MFGQGGNKDDAKPAEAVVDEGCKDDGVPLWKSTAPVTMAVWFDYQCPFCKQFEQTVTNSY